MVSIKNHTHTYQHCIRVKKSPIVDLLGIVFFNAVDASKFEVVRTLVDASSTRIVFQIGL